MVPKTGRFCEKSYGHKVDKDVGNRTKAKRRTSKKKV